VLIIENEEDLNNLELNMNVMSKRKEVFGLRLFFIYVGIVSLMNVYIYWNINKTVSYISIVIAIVSITLFFNKKIIRNWRWFK